MEHVELTAHRVEDTPGEFLIFTHAMRVRLMILTVFVFYFVFFGLFMKFLATRIQFLEDSAKMLEAVAGSGGSQWLGYLTYGTSALLAVIVLFYLAFATCDVWGLQVWISARRIVVKNTILGDAFSNWSGAGELDLKDVALVRGGRLATLVEGLTGRVSFTPVDRLELLISKIIEYAPNAELEI